MNIGGINHIAQTLSNASNLGGPGTAARAEQGAQDGGNAFAQLLARDSARYRRVIRETGIRAE